MDQYNRLLDVFSNDRNGNTSLLATNMNPNQNQNQNQTQNMNNIHNIPEEFSKESKSVTTTTTTTTSSTNKQPTSILSSILHQADTQVRNLTGAKHEKSSSQTTKTTSPKPLMHVSIKQKQASSSSRHAAITHATENDDTSYDINKNELLLDSQSQNHKQQQQQQQHHQHNNNMAMMRKYYAQPIKPQQQTWVIQKSNSSTFLDFEHFWLKKNGRNFDAN